MIQLVYSIKYISLSVVVEFPNKGRCSVEIIKELESMVADLLRVFQRGCGGRLPNKIVFYRDGVDDGQYQKVLDNEVTKIKKACRSESFEEKLEDLHRSEFFRCLWKTNFTEIDIHRCQETSQYSFLSLRERADTQCSSWYRGRSRYHSSIPIRFLSLLSSRNVLFSFSLVLETIVSLCFRMGTSRPTLYHVLHDDIGFTSDDIQQLTYWVRDRGLSINRNGCSLVVSHRYALFEISFHSCAGSLCASGCIRIAFVGFRRRSTDGEVRNFFFLSNRKHSFDCSS